MPFRLFRGPSREKIRRAEEINGATVPLPELMPDSFIKAHTKFTSLQALFDAAEAEGIVNDETAQDDMNSEAFSEFIKRSSSVGDWKDLMKLASDQYVKRKVGL